MPVLELPESALRFGFANFPVGTHGSRTMMLPELRTLLSARPPSAGQEEYRSAAVEHNVLMKGTLTGRRQVFRALRELYALDPSVLLFRALRDLWDWEERAQPLLALLSASARDPVLRATTDIIIETRPGEAVTPQQLSRAIAEAYPGRYSPGLLDHMGRNVASTWRQSGHLEGHLSKARSRAECTPAAVAYALLMGYLCGQRGDGLLTSLWARLLDAPPHQIREQAAAASQRGWIEYRYAGAVTDISFRHFLGNERLEP